LKKNGVLKDSLKFSGMNIWTLGYGWHWFLGQEAVNKGPNRSKQCDVNVVGGDFLDFWPVFGAKPLKFQRSLMKICRIEAQNVPIDFWGSQGPIRGSKLKNLNFPSPKKSEKL